MRFQQTTRKVHRDSIATYEASGVDMVWPKPGVPYPVPESSLRKYPDGGRLPFKYFQLCSPGCLVTTTWRVDANFSTVLHLTAYGSNLSKPQSNRRFLSLRCLDIYVNSDSWVTSPNIRNQDTCNRQGFR